MQGLVPLHSIRQTAFSVQESSKEVAWKQARALCGKPNIYSNKVGAAEEQNADEKEGAGYSPKQKSQAHNYDNTDAYYNSRNCWIQRAARARICILRISESEKKSKPHNGDAHLAHDEELSALLQIMERYAEIDDDSLISCGKAYRIFQYSAILRATESESHIAEDREPARKHFQAAINSPEEFEKSEKRREKKENKGPFGFCWFMQTNFC